MTKRKAYGDFQTPIDLAQQVLELVQRDFGSDRSRILEPTCGLGNFIQAALNTSDSFDEIIGIEIQSDYVQQARHIQKPNTRIEIIQDNIFTTDMQHLDWHTEGNLLVIGNPLG
ncbi:MAG: hypothetical protein Q9P01_03435 [Anaerolineae bacterium]|nr:hypothetical protein [Anaerolineae bacterium]